MPFNQRGWPAIRLGQASCVGLLLVALALAQPATVSAQGADAHDQHAAGGDQPDYPSLKIAGFGDVNFFTTRKPEGAHGFTEGQFALHMASALSARVTFFGEISFSPRTDAGTGTPAAAGFNAEIERMILRFDRSDQLKVSFGRYHTPINFWNTAFHHGQWLQTSIARPEMIQFGGKLLPVHFVGALVEGSVPAGGLNVHYAAGVGNGRGAVISRGGDAGDNNGKRAFLFNGFVKPDHLYGLQAGASVYVDTITMANGDNFGERIFAAHVVWTKEEPEFLAEFAAIRHQGPGGAAPTWSKAFYIQAAYRLEPFNRLWKPYVRFEHIGIGAGDAVFATVPKLDMTTAGVRYDASAFAAVKFEFRSWTRGAGTARNQGGFLQICFTF